VLSAKGEVAEAQDPENLKRLSAPEKCGASALTPSGANIHRSTLALGASGVKASRKNDFPVK
jgi:hypothetical protein